MNEVTRARLAEMLKAAHISLDREVRSLKPPRDGDPDFATGELVRHFRITDEPRTDKGDVYAAVRFQGEAFPVGGPDTPKMTLQF
jgi:hypothetical protein